MAACSPSTGSISMCRPVRLRAAGANGAGKTTTLRLITGLAHPTAGTVSIDGQLVSAGPDGGLRARRGIGVLDQDPRYYGWMTGRELVELAGRLQGLAGGEARARAKETLGLVGWRTP
jgi:ABC-2 type transport system ATP-binding protein